MDFKDAPAFGRRTGIGKALDLIADIESPIIVETGTTRGYVNGGGGPRCDGWATLAWGWWATKKRGRVHTIDMCPEAMDACRELTKGWNSVIEYVCGDSRTYLDSLDVKIDLLYLDSADDPNVCLREFEEAESKLSEASVVLIDDTDPLRGKGIRTIPYMMWRGWTVEYVLNDNERQALLTLNNQDRLECGGIL